MVFRSLLIGFSIITDLASDRLQDFGACSWRGYAIGVSTMQYEEASIQNTGTLYDGG
jgi:hypothetical protein